MKSPGLSTHGSVSANFHHYASSYPQWSDPSAWACSDGEPPALSPTEYGTSPGSSFALLTPVSPPADGDHFSRLYNSGDEGSTTLNGLTTFSSTLLPEAHQLAQHCQPTFSNGSHAFDAGRLSYDASSRDVKHPPPYDNHVAFWGETITADADQYAPADSSKVIDPTAIHNMPISDIFNPPVMGSFGSDGSSINAPEHHTNRGSLSTIGSSDIPSAFVPAIDTLQHDNTTCVPSATIRRYDEMPGIGTRTISAMHQQFTDHRRFQPLTETKRAARDQFIRQKRAEGLSYRRIKELGRYPDALSTLRGRMRELSKPKAQRVRRPPWHHGDVSVQSILFSSPYHFTRRTSPRLVLTISQIELLRIAVHHLCSAASQGGNGGRRSAGYKKHWTKVSELMKENGASYHFSAKACASKWAQVKDMQ